MSLLLDQYSFIFLGGRGSKNLFLCTDFTELDLSLLNNHTIDSLFASNNFYSPLYRLYSKESDFKKFPIIVCLLSYDQSYLLKINHHCSKTIDNNHLPLITSHQNYQKSKLFIINSIIDIDHHGNIRSHGQIGFDINKLNEIYQTKSKNYHLKNIKLCEKIHLVDDHDKNHYIEKCKKIIDQINCGSFYQANLLRYFDVNFTSTKTSNFQTDWKELIYRFYRFSEPMSAIIKKKDDLIISFSPERFIKIDGINHNKSLKKNCFYKVQTFPIKGTLAKDTEDLNTNTQIIDKLAKSSKDRYELNMIIDLMRNDLSQISLPNTVKVVDRGSVHQFATVIHLIAHIVSYLDKDINFSELFLGLFPSGSITGTPKIDAMKAIENYEHLHRGYFMGNILSIFNDRSIDSSVLIRTMCAKLNQPNSTPLYRYAAGSGIVALSNPITEYNEIDAKCAIWH